MGSRFFSGAASGFVRQGDHLERKSSKISGASNQQVETSDDEMSIEIGHDRDVPLARQFGRAFAERTGFTNGDQIVIDAVLGEMATNILTFAGKGEFVFGTENEGGRTGIVIVARDEGPGIPDVSRAFTDGYSTSGRLGLRLGRGTPPHGLLRNRVRPGRGHDDHDEEVAQQPLLA